MHDNDDDAGGRHFQFHMKDRIFITILRDVNKNFRFSLFFIPVFLRARIFNSTR